MLKGKVGGSETLETAFCGDYSPKIWSPHARQLRPAKASKARIHDEALQKVVNLASAKWGTGLRNNFEE
jgi:hypothetical protein